MIPFRTSVFFFVFLTFCAAETQSGGDGGFLFTVPRALRAGRRETACLSLHGGKAGDKADITVNIETTGFRKVSAVTRKTFDAENVGCFELRVPESTERRGKLHLQVKFSSETNYSVNSIEDVNIEQNTEVTFIQTDKEIYKPGDRVKIRILLLSPDLGVPKNLVVPIVKIRNPNSVAIGQWENVTTDLGLVQLEHQLSQETVTGKWRIELSGNSNTFKYFEVKEYVLPRFEVIIDHPESFYINADTFNFSTCAKYSYDRPVKGTSHLKLELLHQNLTINQIKELKNGCAEFIFERSEVPIINQSNFYYFYFFKFLLTATVTEQGTGQLQTTTSEAQITDEKYSLEFVNGGQRFQLGIPYKGQVKINNKFEDLENKILKICYTTAVNVYYNYTEEQCRNFSLNGQNLVDFTIFPFYENTVSIKLNAFITEDSNKTVLHSSRDHFIYNTIAQWYSPSNSYIHISYEPTTTPIKCKAWQTFTILYTLNSTSANITKHPPIIFNYLIKSKGSIFKFGKVSHVPCSSQPFDVKDYENVIGNVTDLKPPLPVDKFILTVKIHQKMFSEGQLLVYFVRDDGEVVGTSVNFDVENCLANKVEANWSDSQNYPGETSVYKIKASAGSLCAVSAIDKKVSLLSKPDNLSVAKILQQVQKSSSFDFAASQKCKQDSTALNNEDFIPPWDLRRRKRFYFGGGQDYDTFQVFNDVNLLVMTDLQIVTRPCYTTSPDWLYFRGSEDAVQPRIGISEPDAIVLDSDSMTTSTYHTQATDNGVAVRSYFPETWLWDLVPIGRTGEIQLKKELPHSITQWLSNTICVSPSAGIGISQPSVITTFKPFFIDVITPYSIKRNEVSHLKIIVHNYLNHSLPVGITLELNSNIRLAGSTEESFITACIGPNDAFTDTFRVTALGLGKVNFTVTAEVNSAYPGECGPEVLLDRKDVIIKSILVQLEGFPFERTLSNFVCANDMSNDTDTEVKEEMKWNVEVPSDSIKNSSRLRILLDADLLELTIENLGSLLNIPTGCGEQIVSTLAPNMYVLRYLKSTGNLNPDIEQKALNYIKIGYERILKYRHRDGSFSAFGETYGDGSMFLTAFVMRTLSQAADYVYIDKNIISRAASWILDKQFENGCFPTKSHVFQSGMTDENDQENVALSAYVLISLMESGFPISEKVRDNAKYCLRGYNSADKYTMAIITYALSLVDWESEASRSLDRLLEIASRQNGLLWWEDSGSLSSSLEMTSYMILSLTHTNNSQRIALAHEATRWLLTKRNSNGGFVSTQDTVVALDALTKFALVANKENTNVSVSVATGGKHFSFRLRNKAKLKTKQVTLTKFSNFVKFKVDGTGCILIQTILRYNMAQIISSEALKLAVSVNPVSTIDKCAITQVNPCFSYTIPNKHINMAVLEISLPSGYRADRSSLFGLIHMDSKVQRFEEIDDKVVLYFTEVSGEKLCVPFLINEESFIQNRTEAIVRLYDYYNPEVSASTSYKLSNCDPIDLSV